VDLRNLAVSNSPTSDFMARSKRVSEMIIVKDDFFKADLANLIAKSTDTYQWRYGHKSDVRDTTHNKFFVSHLWIPSSEDNLFHTLWKLIQDKIPSVHNYDCFRIIANGQIKGQNGDWHTDHGDKTILYYPLAWSPEWGGSTYFEIDGSNEEVPYKQNRLVVFDSAVFHYGACPTVDNVLRISIAFNLRLKKFDLSKTT
jgi:hypothetical protein